MTSCHRINNFLSLSLSLQRKFESSRVLVHSTISSILLPPSSFLLLLLSSSSSFSKIRIRRRKGERRRGAVVKRWQCYHHQYVSRDTYRSRYAIYKRALHRCTRMRKYLPRDRLNYLSRPLFWRCTYARPRFFPDICRDLGF